MDLFSKYVQQYQDGMTEGSVPSHNEAFHPLEEDGPICVLRPFESTNMVDLHLTTEHSQPDLQNVCNSVETTVKSAKENTTKTTKEGKPKIKVEDLDRLQFAVLQEHKRKLIQQTIYYELMNKKLRKEMEMENEK